MSEIKIYDFSNDESQSHDFIMNANGQNVPLHLARVSAFPINRRWPGQQRPLDQTELASFAMLATDGPVTVDLKPNRPWKKAIIRPLCKEYKLEQEETLLHFTLPGPGYYAVELDGYHMALHIFVDFPKDYDMASLGSKVTYFGPGNHEIGLIEMYDNDTLFIDEGAVVFGRIEARDAKNIRILGHGILDGSHCKEHILHPLNAKSIEERNKGFAITNAQRWDLIRLEFCENVTIEGITLRDSLLYNIRPIGCTNLHFENLKLIGNWRYNSDGIDMHNCHHVLIRNCFIRTFDDSICVKGFDYTMDEAQMLHNGRFHNTFEDVLVEHCVIWNDWGRALEIGAETRAKEICSITFRDCDIIHSNGLACDIQNVDYADVHDVLFEDIRVEMDDIHQTPHIQQHDNESFEDDPQSTFISHLIGMFIIYIAEYSKDGNERGIIRDATLRNISVIAPRMPPSLFHGFDEQHQCHHITIENLQWNGTKINSVEEANFTQDPFVSDLTLI